MNVRPPVPLDDAKRAQRDLRMAGVESNLLSIEPIEKLLYLQNVSDRHEAEHAEPLRYQLGLGLIEEGLYASGNQAMAVGNFNSGHRAPAREVIDEALVGMMSPETDSKMLAKKLLLKFGQ